MVHITHRSHTEHLRKSSYHCSESINYAICPPHANRPAKSCPRLLESKSGAWPWCAVPVSAIVPSINPNQTCNGNCQTKQRLQNRDVYLAVVVDDLYPLSFSRNNPGTDGNIKLTFRSRFDPYVVALHELKKTNQEAIIMARSKFGKQVVDDTWSKVDRAMRLQWIISRLTIVNNNRTKIRNNECLSNKNWQHGFNKRQFRRKRNDNQTTLHAGKETCP